jgi:hypothetical protein
MKKTLLLIASAFCIGTVQAQTRYLTVSQSPSLSPLGVNPNGTPNPKPSCSIGPTTSLFMLPPAGGTLVLDATVASIYTPPTACNHFVRMNVEVTVGGMPYGGLISLCPGSNRVKVPISMGGGMYSCFYDITYDPIGDNTTIYFY